MRSVKKANNSQIKKVSSANDSNNIKKFTRSSGLTYLSSDISRKLKEQLSTKGRSLQSIPLALVSLGENIRESYDPEELQKLSFSLENDGLIQFPTLSMKKKGNQSWLVCRNGHRRILAAMELGWERIECIVLPFESDRDELYHTLNANMRENLFYLDIAFAYETASRLGEADAQIAERAGVNVRTVGWYRRITAMSASCRKLVRENPNTFNATWAVKLARSGELPPPKALEKMMREILEGKGNQLSAVIEDKEKERALRSLKKMFKGKNGQTQLKWADRFLNELACAGYISSKAVDRISSDYLSN